MMAIILFEAIFVHPDQQKPTRKQEETVITNRKGCFVEIRSTDQCKLTCSGVPGGGKHDHVKDARIGIAFTEGANGYRAHFGDPRVLHGRNDCDFHN